MGFYSQYQIHKQIKLIYQRQNAILMCYGFSLMREFSRESIFLVNKLPRFSVSSVERPGHYYEVYLYTATSYEYNQKYRR